MSLRIISPLPSFKAALEAGSEGFSGAKENFSAPGILLLGSLILLWAKKSDCSSPSISTLAYPKFPYISQINQI